MPESRFFTDLSCVMFILATLVAFLLPLLTSPYLVIVSAGELAGHCKNLGKRFQLTNLSSIGLLLMLGSALLGLCWHVGELLAIAEGLSYLMMFTYTWILIPIGFFVSRSNGGELPKSLKPVRLAFALAGIPMAVTSLWMLAWITAAIVAWMIVTIFHV